MRTTSPRSIISTMKQSENDIKGLARKIGNSTLNEGNSNFLFFEREDIEEVHFHTISQSPYYTVTVILLVDHRKQEFIPGGRGAYYGEHNVNFQQVRDDIIKFLRTKGNELSEEDTWRGYKFIDDFSRIGF